MKILILSDIHANRPALAAVLTAELHADGIVCLGDLVNYGPHPLECVAWARANVAAGSIVQGNHDYAVGRRQDPTCSPPYRRLASRTQEYTASRLTAEAIDFLACLPTSAKAELGGASWFLCHAAPSAPLFEYVPPDDRGRWIVEWEKAGRPDVLAVGHTHIPFVQRIGAAVIMNPGSVGQPKDGDSRAAYAVWNDGEIRLGRMAYDIDAAAGDLAAHFPPDVAFPLAHVLRTGGRLPESEAGT